MTTTTHPANGPVSLDRLHQISEILSKAAAQSDGGNLGYAMADAVKVIDGAIAKFEEQDNPRPVMAVKGELGFIDNLEKIIEERDEDIDIGQLGSSNYDALMLAALDAFRASLPATVVPNALPENDDEEGNDIDYLETSQVYELGRIAGWNACRSAMLQAGNSPVTPDCWVACSERMPENDDMVNIVIKHVDGSHYVFTGQWWGSYWNTDSDCIDNENVTHWMPLPEPPQEVKSALEHGMQRYSGAMKKLSEGDK